MMEEIFLHLSGSNSALPAMVQILADFASSDGIPTSLVFSNSKFDLTRSRVWILDV